MAPVYEHLHNKRLRKQNGMSLLTSRCLLSILNMTDEQFFPYSYVCRGNILKNNASKNCKQLALAQKNGYRVLPLATVATEKPRFRAHAAIFAIGVTRAREITARGVVWGGKIAASYCNWFMTLTESTPQSTFPEYFCEISTINKLLQEIERTLLIFDNFVFNSI